MRETINIISNSKSRKRDGYKKSESQIQLTPMNRDGEGIITPQEVTELQGSLQELNNDDIDTENRTSGIDLRTRLHNTEISSITVLDTLVQFNFLPISIVPFTLQKKRLAVSLRGKGRSEIVDIVRGKREEDVSKGGGGLFGNLFKKKDNEL